MTESTGLRERKKARTRRALIDAAMRLFEEQGYDKTTLAQIVQAAELSPRTFFLHFTSKDDVVFAANRDRLECAVQTIREHAPGEAPIDVLVRAIEAVLASDPAAWDSSTSTERRRVALIVSVPALQAQLLRRLLLAQQQVTAELLAAYPDRLDEAGAAVLVGAISGAIVNTVFRNLDNDRAPEQLEPAIRHALHTTADAFRDRT